LQKNVRDRFHDIADVRIDLEDASAATTTVARKKSGAWVVHLLWAAAVVALVIVAFSWRRPSTISQLQVDVVTPPEADAGGIALSSDGNKIAYTALINGVPRLYVRTLGNGTVRALPGTEGAALPFWSPDGRVVAFFADSKLKRIDLENDQIQELAETTLSPSGGTWGKDGTILFSPNINGGVYRIPESGQSSPILVVPDGRSPRFLEDGRRFLFTGAPSGAEGGIFLSTLGSSDRRRLLDANVAIPAPPGYLLYSRQGALFIQGFDAVGETLTGVEIPVAQRVSISTDGAAASVTASATGVIGFRDASIAGSQSRRISWFNRSGAEIQRISDLGGVSPSVSPEGAYIAVSRNIDGAAVWLVEAARNVVERFTSGRANQTPLFSPDGSEVVFSSARTPGGVQLFRKRVDGGEDILIELPNRSHNKVATDWTTDYLLYRENSPETGFDIWALPMRGAENKPLPVLKTLASERDAQLSPDGKWIAYESNKSGRSEIYLTRFPTSGREFPVSTNGGAQARWNPSNQNEIFYVSLNGRLTAVALEFSADSLMVRALESVELFQTGIGAVVQGAQKQQYVVSRDGQRFLISNVIEEALSPITLLLNWRPEE
jgi:eukaryotic-like serine/threonine-protein kinase